MAVSLSHVGLNLHCGIKLILFILSSCVFVPLCSTVVTVTSLQSSPTCTTPDNTACPKASQPLTTIPEVDTQVGPPVLLCICLKKKNLFMPSIWRQNPQLNPFIWNMKKWGEDWCWVCRNLNRNALKSAGRIIVFLSYSGAVWCVWFADDIPSCTSSVTYCM